MATKVSNPRDLLVLLLGELLYVERRLAGGVLAELERSVSDEQLAAGLHEHLAETRQHVERLERVFRRLEVAPTANHSSSFEAALRQHGELAGTIVVPELADVFHAQAALHTEHWEIAAYTAVLGFGSQLDRGEELSELRSSLFDEEQARGLAESALERLGGDRGR